MANPKHSLTPWQNTGNYATDANGDYVKCRLNFISPLNPEDAQAAENEALIFASVNAIVACAGSTDPLEFAAQLPARMEAARKLAEHAAAFAAISELEAQIKKSVANIEEMTKREAELLNALRLASDAMEYMGDILNDMDAVEEDDEAATARAFDAVNAVLAKYEPAQEAK